MSRKTSQMIRLTAIWDQAILSLLLSECGRPKTISIITFISGHLYSIINDIYGTSFLSSYIRRCNAMVGHMQMQPNIKEFETPLVT